MRGTSFGRASAGDRKRRHGGKLLALAVARAGGDGVRGAGERDGDHYRCHSLRHRCGRRRRRDGDVRRRKGRGQRWRPAPTDCAAVTSITVNATGAFANTINLAGVTAAAFTGLTTVTVNAGAGADTVTGSGIGDILNGEDGNDALNGEGGNDALSGGPGTDTLNGGADNDLLIGARRRGCPELRGGYDTISFIGSSAGVTVNLAIRQPERRRRDRRRHGRRLRERDGVGLRGHAHR